MCTANADGARHNPWIPLRLRERIGLSQAQKIGAASTKRANQPTRRKRIEKMETKQQLPAMMTTREMADFLAASTQHVRNLVQAGRIPKPKRLGGAVRWVRAEIESWIADGCPQVDAK